MKYSILLLLFSITPMYCLNPCNQLGTQRKITLTKLAQEIFHMNNQIDQAIQQREQLRCIKDIAAALKLVDQLKKTRDTKMRTLHNLRAQSFLAMKQKL